MIETLKEKTGKTLEEWIAIVKQTGLEKHTPILNHLKQEHGLTHGYANLISLKARAADAGSHDADDLVTAQYAKKQELRPIYDALIERISTFGNDVEIAPKKANVSLRRKRQFALIQPSTKTRVDLGLKFNDRPTGERLGNSGPFGSMCSHRVQLSSVEDLDEELIAWLKEAYEEAG